VRFSWGLVLFLAGRRGSCAELDGADRRRLLPLPRSSWGGMWSMYPDACKPSGRAEGEKKGIAHPTEGEADVSVI